MLRFLTRVFTVIGFLVVALIASGIGFAYFREQHPQPEPESIILTVDLNAAIVERMEPSAFDLAMQDEVLPLYDVVRAIDLAKNDPNVKALVARFGATQPSLSKAQEIRDALERFRATGKPMYAFGASYGDFGMGNKAYYLASVFDNIWLQPVGSVGLSGLAIEMPFAKSALEKYGITAHFFQREEYKSAMDNITRDGFAPQVREEMQAMVNDLGDQISGGIAEARKWSLDRVTKLMNEGPYTDDEALKNNLITKIAYADELNKELDGKFGKDATHAVVQDYLAFAREQPNDLPIVAIIYGAGIIANKSGSSITGEAAMGADEIASAFDAAAEDKDVKGILFRVDSPGGSPEASETIRRALTNAQKRGKPVIVSMGEVAASGGYWVSMNADRIIAEPATLTGSIGVIGGKFIVGGALQKLGITWEGVKTSDNAGMWSVANDFTPAQTERVNALMDRTYQVFLKNVSDARHIPMEKMPDIAKGRVWTGAQALKIGLVDELGGYDKALAAVRKAIKIGEQDPVMLEQFPVPETPVERVMKLLRSFGVESAMVAPAIREWQNFRAALAPFMRDVRMKPIEVRMPAAGVYP
jgi:protease-4